MASFGSMARRSNSPWRHVDYGLALATLAVSCFGLLMIYSATRGSLASEGLDPRYFLKRQAVFVVIGLAVMVVAMVVDYRRLQDFAPVFYIGSVMSLLLILSPIGDRSRGSQAWFQVGPYQLEPSEFTKIALIIGLASFCAYYRGKLGARELGMVLALAAIPFFLIYKQPDLGTALVLGFILLGVLLVGGVRGRHLAVLGAIGVLAVTAVLHFGVLQKFQQERLTAFLDTTSQGQASYNLNESKIAIGSGGVAGQGLFKGSQTNLSYVPEQQTDFIFTAVGEQLGLVGSALLLAMFVLIVWRTWRAATTARDITGTLICVGVLAMFVFQIFENIGMTMGIMPITGIPLPFMSYGGSAIVACFAAIGLVLNVQMRRYS
ncbi:MAG: rod shape-determining protein RodA [Acidimicrobiales bacterium]